MLESRARRVRQEVTVLAAAGAGVAELHAAAIGLVGREVGTELTCWAMIDPETLMIGSMTSGEARIPQRYEPLLAEAEYSGTEPHRFAELARRGARAARLSDLSRAETARSSRLNEIWRPLGLDHELRVLFTVDGECWGGGGMVRAGKDFTEREVEFLGAVAPAVAAATRLAVRAEAHGAGAADGPAIVLAGPRGETRALTPAAQVWRDRLAEVAPGRFGVMVRAAVVGARPTGTFHARIRDARGGWLLLRASRLIGDDTETAVTFEAATGEQLLGLLLRAYGLTARERDVCDEVIAGHPTGSIAARLHISANTVQDHLKSVFAKVGVRSRGELVARLR